MRDKEGDDLVVARKTKFFLLDDRQTCAVNSGREMRFMRLAIMLNAAMQMPSAALSPHAIWGNRDASVGTYLQERTQILRDMPRIPIFTSSSMPGMGVCSATPLRFDAELLDILGARS